jgi:hypothetical protein
MSVFRNPFKKREREEPTSGKEVKKSKAMHDRGSPLHLGDAMDTASDDLEGDSDGDQSTPPTRAAYELLLRHNKQLQSQIETLTREVANMRVAMEKMSTQRPLANSPSATPRSSSSSTRGGRGGYRGGYRGGKAPGSQRAATLSAEEYVMTSEKEIQEIRDILALPTTERDQKLTLKLKPFVVPYYPEKEYQDQIIDWLLHAEGHDDPYLLNLFTSTGEAAHAALGEGLRLEAIKDAKKKEQGNGSAPQSYAKAAAKAPSKIEPELKQQKARAKERTVAMSFFQERAPQEWKSATIRWYPGRQYKDPRALNSLAWRAMEKMKIRSAIKDLCLIGKQLIRIYYCGATATKVEAAIEAAKISVVTDLKATPSFESKADIKTSTINRASYLLAKHSSISRLCTLIIQEIPPEWMEECREKAKQRETINNARH